jgi:hypothetical protein
LNGTATAMPDDDDRIVKAALVQVTELLSKATSTIKVQEARLADQTKSADPQQTLDAFKEIAETFRRVAATLALIVLKGKEQS